jgi:hypothetical protein
VIARIVPCLAILCSGCFDPSGPVPPSEAELLAPVPVEYAAWWGLVERCAGTRASFASVRFLTVDSATVPGTESATAAWYSRTNEIVLGADRVSDGPVVRHEMLHAILGQTAHSRKYFIERCAGLVACSGHCVREAGGPVARDLSAPVVNAASMVVGVDLGTRTLSLSSGTECVTLAISVTNPHPTPVRVNLQENAEPGPYPGFGWAMAHGGQAIGIQNGRIPFAAGETQRHVFECAFTNTSLAAHLSPGDHDVYGMFQSVRTAPKSLVVVD